MARVTPPDSAWTIIQSLLPAESASVLAEHSLAEHRMIINGIFWVLGFGAPWRDLPERYGPWEIVYNPLTNS